MNQNHQRSEIGCLLASTRAGCPTVGAALQRQRVTRNRVEVGWFIPMYFAGRLESQNDKEYEDAARLCEALGLDAMRAELKAMAQLERDHEQYFIRKVTGHPALPFWQRFFKWGPEAIPPPVIKELP